MFSGFFFPTLLLILTWRSQLILAGRAGQRQALAESVHPVEPDGDVGFRHGLQGFGGCKGELSGLVCEPRLRGLGVPWTAALREQGAQRDTQSFTQKVKSRRGEWIGQGR